MSQFLNFAGNAGVSAKSHGTGGGTSFTLDVSASTNSVLLQVGGVLQFPGTDFTVSGTTITTTSSVSSGIEVISYVLHKQGTAPVIQDNSVTGGKIALTSQAEGDLMYCNASGDWVRLAKGAAGQVLAQNSGLTAPEWIAAPGGAWDFIETQTASASSSLDFEGISSSSYTSYMGIVEGLICGTANATYRVRVGTGSPTVTYDTGANYDFGLMYSDDAPAGNIADGATNGTNPYFISAGASNGADDGLDGTLYLYQPSNTARNTQFLANTTYRQDTTDDLHIGFMGFSHQSTAAVTGLRLFPSSGNFTSGTIHWYGLTQ